MDFRFHDPGQFAQMLEGRVKLSPVIDVRIARNLFADTSHHGAQFGKFDNGMMSALGQIDRIFAIEQSLNESIELLQADESEIAQVSGGRFHRYADQSERLAAFLMPGQVVPKSLDQGAEQLVDCPAFGFKPPALAGKGFSRRLAR